MHEAFIMVVTSTNFIKENHPGNVYQSRRDYQSKNNSKYSMFFIH